MPCFADARTFPHRDSLLSDQSKYAVIISQFIRYARRSTCRGDFMKRAANLVARMMRHGYVLWRIRSRVDSFRRYWKALCLKFGSFREFEVGFPVAVDQRLLELKSAPRI